MKTKVKQKLRNAARFERKELIGGGFFIVGFFCGMMALAWLISDVNPDFEKAKIYGIITAVCFLGAAVVIYGIITAVCFLGVYGIITAVCFLGAAVVEIIYKITRRL